MRDCLSIIHRLASSTLFSGIDLKAIFLNIPVCTETMALLGAITQDGLYRYIKLVFGLIEAPMFFQYVMEEIINTTSHAIKCEPYLDDLTCHGTTLSEVWSDTIQCLQLITAQGIMINMKKCKLLTSRMQLLGYSLYDFHY